MVVTWFDGVRVHCHVSAAQVLTSPLVCDSKQQWLNSPTVRPALNSQQLHLSIYFPLTISQTYIDVGSFIFATQFLASCLRPGAT